MTYCPRAGEWYIWWIHILAYLYLQVSGSIMLRWPFWQAALGSAVLSLSFLKRQAVSSFYLLTRWWLACPLKHQSGERSIENLAGCSRWPFRTCIYDFLEHRYHFSQKQYMSFRPAYSTRWYSSIAWPRRSGQMFLFYSNVFSTNR